MVISYKSKLVTSHLKIGELLVMPSCREKGKGEQVHGRTQPLKHTIFVGVEYFPLGDLHVARVGQHQGGQKEATHLNVASVREQKKEYFQFL